MEKLTLNRPTRGEVRDERKTVEEDREFEDFLEKRNAMDNTGKYYFDTSLIPEGMVYEWKRATYLGKEDREYMLSVKRVEGGNWKAVPSERHPELAFAKDEPIIIGGLMLMETKKKFVDYMQNKAIEENAVAMANNRKQVEVSDTPNMPRVVQRYSTNRI